jgi:hypothetical protein
MSIFSDEIFSQSMHEYQENKVAIIQHLNTPDNREEQGIIYSIYGIDTNYMEIDWKLSFPTFQVLPSSFPCNICYDPLHEILAF